LETAARAAPVLPPPGVGHIQTMGLPPLKV